MTAREYVIEQLLTRVFGEFQPGFKGAPLPKPDEDGKIRISSEFRHSQFHDVETGWEVVQNIRPNLLFGTGVLHPPEEQYTELQAEDSPSEDPEYSDEPLGSSGNVIDHVSTKSFSPAEEEAFTLHDSQKPFPSAVAVSFSAHLQDLSTLTVVLKGSSYKSFEVIETEDGTDGRARTWHRRIEESVELTFLATELGDGETKTIKKPVDFANNHSIEIIVQRRPSRGDDWPNSGRLITVAARHTGASQKALFHVGLEILFEASAIRPLSGAVFQSFDGIQDLENEVLFQHVRNYSIGHGCASRVEDAGGTLLRIVADYVPIYSRERLSTSLDDFAFSMSELSEAPVDVLSEQLEKFVEAYESWIEREAQGELAMPQLEATRGELAEKAREASRRMRRGIKLLTSGQNEKALLAFRAMNEAMYWQQRNTKISGRELELQGDVMSPKDGTVPKEGKFGEWRPFQIGFLLASLPGVVDENSEERETVDLIHFPTGGGKTEAYLGAAALLMFYRRLEDNNHSGVDVLMRYTLRLLTTQQFERASALIASMEVMRRADPEKFGETPFSIGIWVGNSQTPNTREVAIKALAAPKAGEDQPRSPFLLSKCPWCGAGFGWNPKRRVWVGFRQSDARPRTLKFVCGDPSCEFSKDSAALPIFISDDDLYENRPSLVVATVDKFARLIVVPEARSILNVGARGKVEDRPVGLIIQDELHLISGPLGSMVGLFETAVMALITNDGELPLPKIIASTATTNNAPAQIRSLFANEKVNVFPQAINRYGETFFSRVERDSEGNPMPGTRFVGIFGGTYKDLQRSTAEVCAALSQAPSGWEGESSEMDFYSTAMYFFSSLRDLGQTTTLIQTTVQSILNSMFHNNQNPKGSKTRFIDPVIDLTGQLESSQMVENLERLKARVGERGFIPTCLASSVMEVGVDVQRLGLLTVIGQPKSTSSYIQVSGRVGRSSKGPGLVIMLYSPSRSRDRSIYENFYQFHSSLPAHVEPLSLTPFASKAQEKGLIGAFVAEIRHRLELTSGPEIPGRGLIEKVKHSFLTRAQKLAVDEIALQEIETRIADFEELWSAYQPPNWEYSWAVKSGQDLEDQTPALLRFETDKTPSGDMSVVVPTSMRTVDKVSILRLNANSYSWVGAK